MSNKKIILLMLMTFILPLVLAGGNFNVYEGSNMDPVCPTSTGLFTDAIENTGDTFLDFTITSSGTAAPFSTTVPQGFTLAPGQVKNIFTYVTPMSSTNIGQYSLSISLDSNEGSKTIVHPITVNDCFDYTFEALDEAKHVCPCESEKFDFQIKNLGERSETYYLSLEGPSASAVVLSEEVISLTSGESKLIYAYITSSCGHSGDYDFTVIATPSTGASVKSAGAKLVADACYNFDIQTEQDLISFCEHAQVAVPVQIENEGSTENTYYFDVNGPAWANVENNKLDIPSGQSKTVNLILTPDYGVEGTFEVNFEVDSELGDVDLRNTFNVQVKDCYSVAVDVSRSEDKICNALENTYGVTIRNDGELTKSYAIELEGPSWATLDENRVDLEAGEEKEVTLTISPTYNTVPATYNIKVKASATDSDKIAAENEIEVTTVSEEECYQAKIGLEETKIEVYYDASATVPIVVENMGTYMATYDVSVTGTAANFVYLNPSIIALDESKSELIYLYVAPSAQVPNGDYSATISVRLGDSTILASKTINIKVTDSGAAMPTGAVVVNTGLEGTSIFQKVSNFFKSLFEVKKETEALIDENLEVTEEETPEVTEEETPEVTEEETPEVTEELTYETITALIGIDEPNAFNLGEEEHTITLTEIVGETQIVITINSDPILVALDIGESKEIDMNEDGVIDVIVRFDGMVGDKADITYEYLNFDTEVADITGAATTDLEEATREPLFAGLSSMFGSLMGYSNYLIGLLAIILVILVAMRTNFHKKVVDFFEEEIEEEDYKDLTVEEEPKETEIEIEEPVKKTTISEAPKKEVKKEEPKKEGPKEEVDEEDDDDEVIIEFDDEEEE